MEIKVVENKQVFLRGKKENILIDPDETGLNDKKYQSRIVLFTGEKPQNGYIESDKVIIGGPGEYEVGGVEILGFSAGNGKTIYAINIDGIVVGVLGSLQEVLSDKKIEKINAVDVLVASIEVSKEVNGKLILDWAKNWGANYIVPFMYSQGSEDLKAFLDVADQESLEPVDGLKVEKDNLPEGMEVVLINS